MWKTTALSKNKIKFDKIFEYGIKQTDFPLPFGDRPSVLDQRVYTIQADFPLESMVAKLHYLVRKSLRNESNFPREAKLLLESEKRRDIEKRNEENKGCYDFARDEGVEGTRAHIIIVFPSCILHWGT